MQTINPINDSDAGTLVVPNYDVAPFGLDGYIPADTTDYVDRESLFRDFAPLVRRLIMHYGGNGDLREELVGEIYCRFCALYDLFDPKRGIPIRPYMVRQLSASIYTFVRSYRRCAGRELAIESGIDEIHQSLRIDPTDSWNDQMMLDSIVGILPQALKKLPERQQKVVLWRYIHAWSFDDIASHLSIQPATARSLLRHGLNNLRKWFLENKVQPE